MTNTLIRFFSHVPIGAEDCWVWQGAKKDTGYGAFRLNGRTLRAHRVAYELLEGPIPDGMIIMHTCDNRACVRLDHLRLATQAENILDMFEKGRDNNHMRGRTHCKLGHTLEHNGRQLHCKTCARDRRLKRASQ